MNLSRQFKSAGLISAVLAIPASMAYLAIHASHTLASSPAIIQTPAAQILNTREEQLKIQLAILLDTSSSMDGLIDQTRQQIWQVVNEFSSATQGGRKPVLEVAVFEYGNNALASANGYIRQVSALTTELDAVSEALFSLKTNGGEEYCGQVIDHAVKQLAWSQSNNDIKAIFIAGNEAFSQGPVPFREAIQAAKTRGIIVNTIHAGDYDEGARSGWKDGAVLAGGNFMSIDHNHQVAHIDAPQDDRIAELNTQLNQTYIPYGSEGMRKHARQMEQDANSSRVSSGLLAKRAKSKSSSYYENSSWDLVDAHKNGSVDLENLEEESLPDTMRDMSTAQRKQYIKKAEAERSRLQAEIVRLSQARDAYVTEQRRKQSQQVVSTVEDALITAIRKQAEDKHYEFKN